MFSWKNKKANNTPQKTGLVGVSLLETAISIAYITKEEKNTTLKAYHYAITKDLAEQKEILTNFVKQHELNGVDCSYVLPNKDYVLALIDLLKDAKTGMILNIKAAIKELINYPVEETVFDLFELPLPRASDNTPLGYVVAINKALVPHIEQTVEGAGLNLRFIDIPEMTLRNVALLHPETQNGVLFYHLMPKGGSALLMRKDSLYVARKVNISLDKLNNEADELLERLTLELQRSMDYCTSLFRYSPASSILLSPAEIDASLIQNYLQSSLGIEVKVLNLTDFLKTEAAITLQQQAQCLSAIGAALRGQVGN